MLETPRCWERQCLHFKGVKQPDGTEESEVVYMGAETVEILIDKYQTGSGDFPTIQYKDGSSKANCLADSWNNYTEPFVSTGYVQIRVEN